MNLYSFLLLVGAATLAYGLWHLSLWLSHLTPSPLRELQGPGSPDWITGHLRVLNRTDAVKAYAGWIETYGSTLSYNSMFGNYHLLTTDLKAINHILNHPDIYPKDGAFRFLLEGVTGQGLFLAQGEQHRRQRKIMNPAFGPVQIRALTDIFVRKSVELRDVWMSTIKNSPSDSALVDVIPGLVGASLDMIGLAGFDYDFHALDPTIEKTELEEAFDVVFRTASNIPILDLLKQWFPFLRIIPTAQSKSIKELRATMQRIGAGLLAKAKASATASSEKGASVNSEHRRDLLGLLVNGNMKSDIEERLSDDVVIDQVPTFLAAGHETISNAVSWAFYALSVTPGTQEKLHAEITSVESDSPTMDDLNALPYLDAVVRETLRLYAPIQFVWRETAQDDVIPVSKPYMDKHGVMRDHIRIGKGDGVAISIANIHISKELWGDDAEEFKPERWQSLPDPASHIPGVWGHLLTFLGGPPACIGYRFALVEMKALLFVLLRSFQFELAVSPHAVKKAINIFRKPVVVTERGENVEMPMLMRALRDK